MISLPHIYVKAYGGLSVKKKPIPDSTGSPPTHPHAPVRKKKK